MDAISLFSWNHVGIVVAFGINFGTNLEDFSRAELDADLATFAALGNDVYLTPRYGHALNVERRTRQNLHIYDPADV
jgi:cytolysin (calcineurin-like family phosphatase)